MKKISYIFVLFALLFQIVPSHQASAAVSTYKGGLLDGLPISTGTSVGSTATTLSELTDDSIATYKQMGTNIAWYSFISPQEINEVIINNVGSSTSTLEFYDNKNIKIGEYTPINNDAVESLPTPVTGVSTVVLKKTASSATLYVREFNVYTTPSAAPNVPTINFSAAWDKVTELVWTSTGAKAYNIKRSEGTTGVFTTIATGIKGTSYTDSTVVNNQPYQYAVTATNDVYESGKSNVVDLLPNATKYTGGLLDRLTINVGATVGTKASTTRKLTDNNAVNPSYENMSTNVAWYTFSAPQEINAVIVNNVGGYSPTLEFYDKNNIKLGEYTPITNDGIESLSKPLTGVSTIALKKSASTSVLNIREFNVFATPKFAPNVPTIGFTSAWDKVTEINWTSTGAKWYNIKRSESASGPFVTIATDIKGTSYTDTSVINGKTYYYVVSASNEGDESTNSTVSPGLTPNSSKYTGGLLDRLPINVGATVGTTTSTTRKLTDNVGVNPSYENMSTNVAWYTFSAPQEINAVIVNNVSGYSSTLEFYDKNNIKLGEYTPVTNDVKETLPSPITGVYTIALKKTASSTILYIREFNVFGQKVPTPNLTAVAGDAKVTLNWDATVANATGYIVKRSETAGGPYTDIQTVTGATYTYLDTNVTNGKTYYYAVIAKIGTSESALSNEVSATPKKEVVVEAPKNLTATPGDKQVLLKWSAVDGAIGYVVKRGTTAGGTYTPIASVPAPTVTYLDTDVLNGTKYYYVVTAILSDETESANSNEASATPKAGDVVDNSGDRALLTIMLSTGEQKEYDVTMTVVNAFVKWYEDRAAGVGPVTFAIDKQSNNIGPFKNRKDYIIYDKIITFEVNEYTVTRPASAE